MAVYVDVKSEYLGPSAPKNKLVTLVSHTLDSLFLYHCILVQVSS